MILINPHIKEHFSVTMVMTHLNTMQLCSESWLCKIIKNIENDSFMEACEPPVGFNAKYVK